MRATRKNVTYRVTGNASLGLITYLDRFGKAAQLIADLPWSSSFQIENGKTLFLEARPVSYNGTFKCEIMVDGKAVESSPLSDGFISVRCETRLLQ